MTFLRCLAAGMTCLLVVGLTGCREDEANRPVSFEPGVYQGPQDQKLTDEQLKALTQRGGLQK